MVRTGRFVGMMVLALCWMALAPAAVGAEKVVVVVNSDLAALIQPDLDGYISDLRHEGFEVTQKNWSLTAPGEQKPADLKAYLGSINGLGGAVFIGNLPVAWYYLPVDFSGSATYPADYYYMSLSNVWTDADNNGTFDTVDNYGNSTATIWVSRIKAGSMTVFSGQTEAALVSRYLRKIHRFRIGELRLADRGLLWADTDWKSTSLSSIGFDVAYKAADCTRMTESVAGVITDTANWLGLANVEYETEYFMCHSSDTCHQPGSTVGSSTMAALDFKRLFWNCWNCSSGRFTTSDYIAGVRLFTPTNGLLAIASTKTGSMYPFGQRFYSELGTLGSTHGTSFKNYFGTYNGYKSNGFRQWNDGLVLLGDGTLRLGRHMNQFWADEMDVQVKDDTAQTTEDVACTIPVLANDVERNGGNLTITAVSQPSKGTVTFTDSTVTFTPGLHFYGIATFTYIAANAQGFWRQGTVTVSVNNVPGPVVCQNDHWTLVEDSKENWIESSLSANDTDYDLQPNPNGSSLRLVKWTTPAQGTIQDVTVSGLTRKSYVPNPNFAGDDSFTYWMVNPAGITNFAVCSVEVMKVNDLPVAVADTATVNEDSSVTINVAANDTDVDGDTLTVSAVVKPTTGSVTYSGGSVTFTPNANFKGATSFKYTVSDGKGGSASATVNITVVSVNDAPVAVADPVTTTEDVAKAISVLTNDIDVDGDVKTVVSVTAPANGTVTMTTTTVTYKPNLNWSGVDSFTYTIKDPGGLTSSATVTVTVTPVNDLPVAVTDTATTAEESAITINVLANDTDVDGDALSISAVTQPTTGGVTYSGGSVTYTPNLNFKGATTFKYTVIDGKGGTVQGTVNVTVNNVNDAPVAVADTATTTEDVAKAISVLTNDTDVDGDVKTVVSVTAPANGTVTMTTTTVTYKPNLNWSGVDSFTYTIKDPSGLTSSATVTVTVTPVNDLPVAVTDTATTAEESAITINVLANDTDVDGDVLSISAVTQPTTGVVTYSGGSVTYTPNLNFKGATTFKYTVIDGKGGSAQGTVNITANNVNDAPVAVADTATTTEDVAKAISVLTNDIDVDGDVKTVVSVTAPANGTVTMTTTTVTYKPNLNWSGVDSFTYTMKDPSGLTSSATVTVTVTPVNDLPVAVTDTATTAEESAITINVLANDTDADGDALSISAVTQPTTGVVTYSGGSVTYTPNLNFKGATTFKYTVIDGKGGTVQGTVNVTVNNVNDAPVAVADTATTTEDVAKAISVLTNDIDVDGDVKTVVSVTAPANGTVTMTTTAVTYKPNLNWSGVDSFTYTMKDPSGLTSSATVTVTVTPVDDAPVAVADTATTAEDTAKTVAVLANDSDADGDAFTLTAVTQPLNGTVVMNAADVTYTPKANWYGTDTFKYTITSAKGQVVQGTVTMTVTAVNDAPVANPDSASTAMNTAVTISVLTNDTDPENQARTLVSVGPAAQGTVVKGTTTVTYTPAAGWTGTDTFTYVIKDASNATSTGTVTVVVNP